MPRTKTKAKETATVTTGEDAAYLLSLIGGILILISGLAAFSWAGTAGFTMSMFVGYGAGFMGNLGAAGNTYLSTYVFAVGLISGLLIIYSAFMMKAKPYQRRTWGIVTMVFAFLGFTSAIGWLLGPVLGVVGGILAVSEPRK